jgi:hypothetical protein
MTKKVKIPKSKIKMYTGNGTAEKSDFLSRLAKSDKKLGLKFKKK